MDAPKITVPSDAVSTNSTSPADAVSAPATSEFKAAVGAEESKEPVAP